MTESSPRNATIARSFPRPGVVNVLRDQFMAVVLVALVVVDLVLQPGLGSVVQFGYLVQGALTLVFVAAAQTLVVMTGGLDLSVAGNLALANVLTATLTLRGHESRPWMVVPIILIAAVAGVVNGLLVAYLDVQPFVATLATWSILTGIALLVLPTPGGSIAPEVTDLFSQPLGPIPRSFIVLIVVIALWVVFRGSRAGLDLRAVGGDRVRAHLNGIAVRRVVLRSYVASGALAGIAGVYLASVTSGGDPTLGDAYVLPSITAVVVGGTWLSGGEGGIGRTIIGVFVLTVLADLVLAIGLTPNMSIIASSALLLIVVGTQQVVARVRGARR